MTRTGPSEPAVVAYWPAMQAEQLEASTMLVVPTPQLEHPEAPTELAYWPAAPESQLALPVKAWYLPVSHARHESWPGEIWY